MRFFWNANNTFGFERVPWHELNETATITTVSRFMKHKMWDFGVDPHVIPNGIATQWLDPCDRNAVQGLKRSTEGRLLLAKVARWDPDKRWLMAIDAVGELSRHAVCARSSLRAAASKSTGVKCSPMRSRRDWLQRP